MDLIWNKDMHANTTISPVITFLCKRLLSPFFYHLTHAHVQPMSPSPWHEGWESPAPSPDKYQHLFQKLQLAEHRWCPVHSSSIQTSADSLLFPSDGCLLGTFPFDFVLEQGGAQPCPAQSRTPRSGSSAQSQPCVVWVCRRAMDLLPFLSAIQYLPTHAAHLNVLPTSIQQEHPPFTGWENRTS